MWATAPARVRPASTVIVTARVVPRSEPDPAPAVRARGAIDATSGGAVFTIGSWPSGNGGDGGGPTRSAVGVVVTRPPPASAVTVTAHSPSLSRAGNVRD